MAIFKPTKENIIKGAEIIKNGGLVVFPTETVYGLGANALDAVAVAKIFEAKKRPHFDPLIVHVPDEETLREIAVIENDMVSKLAKEFWPGPLTMILKKRENIPLIVTSGLDTVAVRIPDNPIARELIKLAGGAVAAPSANPFGYLSPTTAEHVEEQLGESVDMIIDGGACRIGLESTVVDMTGDIPKILRPGGLEREKIEMAAGKVEAINRRVVSYTSPGQMENHYSPLTPLIITDDIDAVSAEKAENGAVLLFKERKLNKSFKTVEILSPEGNYVEAASKLFQMLHILDKSGAEAIYCERVPEEGLGTAIMDRIYKASKK